MKANGGGTSTYHPPGWGNRQGESSLRRPFSLARPASFRYSANDSRSSQPLPIKSDGRGAGSPSIAFKKICPSGIHAFQEDRMTVSPSGRQSRAEQSPSPTGRTGDSVVLPPTLLRLPNVVPPGELETRQSLESSGAAAAVRGSTDPNAVSSLSGRTAEIAGPRDTPSPAIAADPLPPAEASSPVPSPPAGVTPPLGVVKSRPVGPEPIDSNRRMQGVSPQEKAGVSARERQSSIDAEPPGSGTAGAGLLLPTGDSTELEHRLAERTADRPNAPPRRTPVRQGSVPEGRSWMERLGSQSIVVIVLMVLAATAILAGRKRDARPDPALEFGASEERLTTPDTHVAEVPATTSIPAPGSFAIEPPRPRSESPTDKPATDSEAADESLTPEFSLNSPVPTFQESVPASRKVESPPGTGSRGNSLELASESISTADAVERSIGDLAPRNRDSDSRSGPDPLDVADVSDVKSDAADHSYRQSSTPYAIRDWSRYLPDLATDYVADRPDATPTGSQSTLETASPANETRTIPSANYPPIQR